MSAKHLVAAMMAVAVAAPLSAQSVRDGIDAWQRADYAGAVAIWRPLAEKGDPQAAFNLAQAYRLGRGVAINLGAAQIWYERSAASGNVDAQTNLGLLVFQNGDHAGGLKWLKQAAAQDDPRALLIYGTALYNGDGVAQNRLLGYAYVSRAATQGLGPAQETLAQLDQLMTTADRQKALALARAVPSGSPVPAKPRAVKVASAKPPVPKPVAAPVSPVSGGWRIQLGAFSQRGSAEALYQRVAGKPALAGRSPYYIASGAVIRLQVGPFASKGAAAAACAAIGVPCFPVPAK